MLFLNKKSQYVAVVDMTTADPKTIEEYLKDNGFSVLCIGVDGKPQDAILFYESKKPFWKRWI